MLDLSLLTRWRALLVLGTLALCLFTFHMFDPSILPRPDLHMTPFGSKAEQDNVKQVLSQGVHTLRASSISTSKQISAKATSTHGATVSSTTSATKEQASQSKQSLIEKLPASDPVTIMYDPRTDDNDVRPEVAKVSMLYGDWEYYERAMNTHMRYAQRHGYPVYVLKKTLIKGVWNKLLYLIHVIMQEMHRGDRAAKWIMWTDADSAVVNPALPLSMFLPPDDHADIHFLGTKDHLGFNAGMFFIKVHPWSLGILANAMTYEHHRPELDLGFLEQTSLYYELNQTENRGNVLWQPRRWYNTYEFGWTYEGKKGDMFVHFAGLQHEKLWTRMGAWLDILEGPRQKDWELSLNQTQYPARIAEFWAAIRGAEKTLRDAEQEMKQANATATNKALLKNAVDELQTVLWTETDQVATTVNATRKVHNLLR